MSRTLDSRPIENLHWMEPYVALETIRDQTEALCSNELFDDTMDRVRTSMAVNADVAMNLMPMLSRFAGPHRDSVLNAIMEEFFRAGDATRFGLANAITATARETHDPDLKWRLEELGGGMLIGVVPHSPTGYGRGRNLVDVTPEESSDSSPRPHSPTVDALRRMESRRQRLRELQERLSRDKDRAAPRHLEPLGVGSYSPSFLGADGDESDFDGDEGSGEHMLIGAGPFQRRSGRVGVR